MRKYYFFGCFFLLFFVFFLFAKRGEAAYLKLEPSTVSTNSNETFTIDVSIDTENEEVNSTDIYINYDANLLEAQQVSGGAFFPTVTNNITSGKLYIAALVDPASSKKGTGTVATITFKALNDGSVTLSVDCDSSKIVKADINSTNILDCSKNGSSQITIGTGNQPQSTDQSQSTNESQSNNQTQSTDQSQSSSTAPTSSPPSSLPRSGVFENFINIGLPGIVLFSLGLIGKILVKYQHENRKKFS